jgi:hypothetical protein
MGVSGIPPIYHRQRIGKIMFIRLSMKILGQPIFQTKPRKKVEHGTVVWDDPDEFKKKIRMKLPMGNSNGWCSNGLH